MHPTRNPCCFSLSPGIGGGGLNVLEEDGMVVRESVISGNAAVEGGGIYLPPGAEVELK